VIEYILEGYGGNKKAMIKIRTECPEDLKKIRHVYIEAFETETEAELVEALRDSGIPIISLVAEYKGELSGHIMFSPMTLDGKPEILLAALAPLAVLPEHQRKGIGSRLVNEGIPHCRTSEYSCIVVLGWPEFYPRFGFTPSTKYGIKTEYDVPEEVFMVLMLTDDAAVDYSGTAKYHQVFNQF